MNEIFKLVLSLSLSGSVLIAVIFACRHLLGGRLSKRFQYYIWIVVVLRLLLPFSPESGIIAGLWKSEPLAWAQPVERPEIAAEATEATESALPAEPAEATRPPQLVTPGQAASDTPRDGVSVLSVFEALWPYVWILWLAVAAGLMIRKITLYQSFVKYLRAGRAEVDGIKTLDEFAELSGRMGVRRVIDLYTNRLIASPLLLGFRKPAVVLPKIPDDPEEFRLICLHELTHYKRRDIYYKWLLQAVLCLHWFNPLVCLMVREVNRSCELSCDESVLRMLSAGERRRYGDALLRSLQTPGTYREGLAALTLSENARTIKERLDSIMRFTKRNKVAAILAVALAALLFVGGYALGAYAMEPESPAREENVGISPEGLPIMSAANRGVFEKYIDRYYMTGLLRHDFSPEDPSALVANGGSVMMSLYNILRPVPLTDVPEPVPASEVKELLMAKLDVNEAAIDNAFADVYDEETDAYEMYGGIGGGPATPIVTGSERRGDMLTVHYTWYDGGSLNGEFYYAEGDSGVMIVRLRGDDYQYVSNKVIPLAGEVTVSDRADAPNYSEMSVDELQTAFILPLGVSKVITKPWETPDEIDPDDVLITLEIKLIDEFTHTDYLHGDNLLIPDTAAESYAAKYFGMNAAQLRSSSYYDAGAGDYVIPFGLGGAWDARATGRTLDGNKLEILYVIINSDGLVDSQGVLTVQLNTDGGYQYLSNRMEDVPQGNDAYVNQRLRSMEENIILLSVVSNLTVDSWDNPMEIAPDHFFEFYEAMVIYGETERLAGEYISVEVVMNAIGQHFDVDAAHVKQSGYYDAGQDAFYVGGLGNVLDFTIEDVTEEGENTVIPYSIYFDDELQGRGEMTVRLQDGGYKFVSNRVIPLPEQAERPEAGESADALFYARELMKQAHDVFSWYYNDAPLEMLWIETDAPQIPYGENGLYYRKVERFQSIDELWAATELVFTKAFCEANFADPLAHEKFLEIDGALYVGDNGGIDEGATWPPREYIVRSVTEDEIILTAICEGPDRDAVDRDAPLIDYSFELVLRQEGPVDENSDGLDPWRVDSYYAYSSDGEYRSLQPRNSVTGGIAPNALD